MKKRNITYGVLALLLLVGCVLVFSAENRNENSKVGPNNSSVERSQNSRRISGESSNQVKPSTRDEEVMENVRNVYKAIPGMSLGELGKLDREIALLARVNLREALLFAESLPPGEKRKLYLRMISSEIPDGNAREFAEMVLKLPLNEDHAAIANILNSTSRPYEGLEAINLAAELRDTDEFTSALLTNYAANLFGEELPMSEALKAGELIPEDDRPSYRKLVLLANIAADPAGSLDSVMNTIVKFDDDKSGIYPGDKDDIVRQLSTKLGGEGVDLVRSISEASGGFRHLKTYLSTWVRADSLAVGDWVLELPDDESKKIGKEVVRGYLLSIGQAKLADEWR